MKCLMFALGNAYTGGEIPERERLPKNLGDAAERMVQSKLARELFGEVFVEHFAATRIWEWRQYQVHFFLISIRSIRCI
jgi:glutamine synthetase